MPCLPLDLMKLIRNENKGIDLAADIFIKENSPLNNHCAYKFNTTIESFYGCEDNIQDINEDAIHGECEFSSESIFYLWCAIWRKEKHIIQFDPDLAKELLKQDFPRTIPVSVFNNLPLDCFYVDYKFSLPSGYCYDGFLFQFYEFNNCNAIWFGFTDSKFNNPITVSIKITDNIIDPQSRDTFGSYRTNVPLEDMRYAVLNSLQLLLYLCSENAEIEKDKNKKIIRKTKIRDNWGEVQLWKAGEHFGNSYRQWVEIPQYHKTIKGGTPKRPHLRKGHYHHYWIGKQSEDRKLILKWIPPTLINKDKTVK